MKIIVCNIGSTSFKFQLLDMGSETTLARGYTERVGTDKAIITYWRGGEKVLSDEKEIPSQREAVQHALNFLIDPAKSIVQRSAIITIQRQTQGTTDPGTGALTKTGT